MTQQGVDILHLPETTTTNENDVLVKQDEATTLTEKIKASNFFNFIKTKLNIITSILSTSSNNEIPTAKAVIDFTTEEIRKNASTFRGSWNNWTSVPSDYTLYPADISGNKKPEINDIIIINNASDYTEETLTGTWRFRYAGEWDIDGKDGWVKEYQIEVDMEEYVEKTTTIAGIDLQDNITARELRDSLSINGHFTVSSISGTTINITNAFGRQITSEPKVGTEITIWYNGFLPETTNGYTLNIDGWSQPCTLAPFSSQKVLANTIGKEIKLRYFKGADYRWIIERDSYSMESLSRPQSRNCYITSSSITTAALWKSYYQGLSLYVGDNVVLQNNITGADLSNITCPAGTWLVRLEHYSGDSTAFRSIGDGFQKVIVSDGSTPIGFNSTYGYARIYFTKLSNNF